MSSDLAPRGARRPRPQGGSDPLKKQPPRNCQANVQQMLSKYHAKHQANTKRMPSDYLANEKHVPSKYQATTQRIPSKYQTKTNMYQTTTCIHQTNTKQVPSNYQTNTSQQPRRYQAITSEKQTCTKKRYNF